jgi:GT2 family glycosyltransferase
LDADVVLPNEFLSVCLNEIAERKLTVATAPIRFLSGHKIDKFFGEFYNFYARLTQSFYPHAPGFCIFCKKELHDKIKGFDEVVTLAEDHDYVVRAGRQGKFGLLAKVIFRFPRGVLKETGA